MIAVKQGKKEEAEGDVPSRGDFIFFRLTNIFNCSCSCSCWTSTRWDGRLLWLAVMGIHVHSWFGGG